MCLYVKCDSGQRVVGAGSAYLHKTNMAADEVCALFGRGSGGGVGENAFILTKQHMYNNIEYK